VNLSRPDEWVETFGLTIIEAMAFGIPSIVPTIGGPAELVEEGENGFKVSCYNMDLLNVKLNHLFFNREQYFEMQKNCLIKSRSFSLEEQIDKIHTIFQNMETTTLKNVRNELIINH
jgi:glycosyltransferase involved in cell wall biosynthesis